MAIPKDTETRTVRRKCIPGLVVTADMLPRVNNKEGKRASNALYTLYKMFLESHAPGIQKLTNESAQFKCYVVGVASSAS